MSNSVGGVDNSQLSRTDNLPTANSTTPGAAVGSGYDTQNSVSIANGATEAKNSGIAPQVPTGSTLNSANFLLNGIKSRLNAFRSSIVISSALAANRVDLSDTQSLLMALRGFLDELKVANKVNGVDVKATNRSVVNMLSSEINQLKPEIAKINEQIQQKKAAIQSAQTQNLPVTELKNELAALQADSTRLEVQMATKEVLKAVIKSENNLQPTLAEMLNKPAGQQSKESGEEQLNELKHQLQVLTHLYEKEKTKESLATDFERSLAKERVKIADRQLISGISPQLEALIESPQMKKLFEQLSGMITPPPTPLNREGTAVNKAMADTIAALGLILMAVPPMKKTKAKTGTPPPQPFMASYQEEAAMIAQTLKRRGSIADLLPPPDTQRNPLQPKKTDDPTTATDSVQPNKLARSGNDIEPAVLIRTNEAAKEQPDQTPTQPIPTLPTHDNSLQPIPSAGQENPYDQPHLGDNLSAEGANNPQAYNLLMLEEYAEKMAEELKEEIQKNLRKFLAQSSNSQLFDLMLHQEQRIEEIVEETLKDQEGVESAIQQAQKI